ncbi:MAG TPA: DUF1992 domain-containing protein [Rubrivivax sp.]|nr:DUF1992 domain-containing protein [Rubrivivax sp.]
MSAEVEKRERRLVMLEDHIGRALARSEQSGELRSARSYGKPLDLGDGYEQTPAELRMAYKILKDAGVLPPEVQWMRDIEALRQRLVQASGDAEAAPLRQRLCELQQQLALRLEKLRISGSL